MRVVGSLSAALLLTSLSAPAQVIVTAIAPGLAAEHADVQVDDILIEWRQGNLQGPLHWPFDILLAEQAHSRLEGASLRILRNDQAMTVTLPAGVWGITGMPHHSADPTRADALKLFRTLSAGNSSQSLAKIIQAVDRLTAPDTQRAVRWMLAEALDQKRDTATAGDQWEQVLEKTTDPAEQALLHYRLGRAALMIWDAGTATERLNRAMSYWSEHPSPQHRMRALTQLGFTTFHQRDLAGADQAFSEAATAFRAHPALDPVGASALRGLGQVRSIQGRFDEAIALGEEALTAIRQTAPDSISEAKILNFMGFSVARTHDVTRGEMLIRSAINMAEALPNGTFEAAGFRNNLALIYYLRQDYDLARELYQQALEPFEQRNPISPVVARTRYNIALTLSRQQRHSEAASMFETVLDLQQQLVPGTEDVARTLHSLAIQHEAAGNLDRAISTELEAREIYARILPSSYVAATSVHKLGQLYFRNDNLTQAQPILEEALELILGSLPDGEVHAQTVFDLGELRHAMGDREGALALYREAVEIVESLQARLGGGDGAISSFRQYYSHFFRRLLEAELAAGNTLEAFAVSERYRAQSFLALLGARPSALINRLPADLKDQWESAQKDYETALKAAAGAEQTGRAALSAARQRWRNTGDELRSASDIGTVLAPQATSPSQIANQLNNQQALVSFVAQQDHVDAFVITADGELTYHPLPLNRTQLKQSANQIRVLLGVPDAGQNSNKALEKALSLVGESLISPLKPRLANLSRLIVIPDEELWLLPLAALRVDDHYLIEDLDLQLGWSATAYAREPPPPGQGSLMAFADPQASDAAQQDGNAQRNGVRSNLQALPGARLEVNQIADLFASAQVFLDEHASESNLRDGVVDAGVLHVAAHAVTQVDPPMESYLQLSADDRHDGRLMAWEVLENLSLKAQLVALSGCATAMGQGAAGEGLRGLTRAFGIAGARRVMASLWPVSDQATASLMGDFYQHRADGNDDAAALRKAQLAFLKPSLIQRIRSGFGADRSHPFYWAAFSLYGSR